MYAGKCKAAFKRKPEASNKFKAGNKEDAKAKNKLGGSHSQMQRSRLVIRTGSSERGDLMRRSKYGNKKVTVNGMTFDSKKEFNRWNVLQGLQEAGKIKNLQRQVKFLLIPSQREWYMDGFKKMPGKLIERECSYKADFVYIDTATGKTVVEDTKGAKTPDYIIKRKMMLYFHNIRIHEI